MTQRQCSAGQPILVGQGNVLQQNLGCKTSPRSAATEVRNDMLKSKDRIRQIPHQHNHVSSIMSAQGCRAWNPGLTLSQVSQSLFPPLISPPNCAEQRKEHLQCTNRKHWWGWIGMQTHACTVCMAARAFPEAEGEPHHEACDRPIDVLCPSMLYVCEEEDRDDGDESRPDAEPPLSHQ